MKCTNCGKEITSGQKYCKYCGEPVKIQAPVDNLRVKICGKCGAPIKDGFVFCDQCGAPIDVPEKQGKKGVRIGKIICILLFVAVLTGAGLLIYKRAGNNNQAGNGGDSTEIAIGESASGATEEHPLAEFPAGTAEKQGDGEVTSGTTQQNKTEESLGTTKKQNETESSSAAHTTEPEIDTITAQTSVGDFIFYGTYEQNNITDDGKEPIEWIVLDKEDDGYLLITSEVIDCICYNKEWKDTTWENCSLREWLNTSFLTEAFTKSQIDNIAYSEHTDEDGNRTTDRVFIMNKEELQDYFGSNNLRMAGATLYAEAQGVYEYTNGNCWWWVSDAGADPHYAKYVNCEGAILEYGMLVFNNAFGVRPAIWVKR